MTPGIGLFFRWLVCDMKSQVLENPGLPVCDILPNVPEIVSLQFENADIVEPVKGEARDLDQPVLVQLENPKPFQVDEHLITVVGHEKVFMDN